MDNNLKNQSSCLDLFDDEVIDNKKSKNIRKKKKLKINIDKLPTRFLILCVCISLLVSVIVNGYDRFISPIHNQYLIEINNVSDIMKFGNVDKKFLNSRFGDSKDVVLKNNSDFNFEEIDKNFLLRHNVSIFGLRGNYSLEFENNKLISAKFYSLENYQDLNIYLQDWELIKNEFIKEFGQPSKEDKIWDNEGNKSEQYAQSIASGKLEYLIVWERGQEVLFLKMDKSTTEEYPISINFGIEPKNRESHFDVDDYLLV